MIAGAGLSGSVFARIKADQGHKVLVIEKRPTIAGNLYDEKNEHGILVQKYGPHTFHTNNEEVHQFVTRYATWKPYTLQCEVSMLGKSTPSPFNFKTIDQFYDEEDAKFLKETLLEEYPDRKTVTVVELLESKKECIRKYADFLFKNDYAPYTAKQWDMKPEDIDVSVLRRVPVRLDYESRYFTDKYEYHPEGGYTQFISNLLNHPNIEVRTNTDALDFICIEDDTICFKGIDTTADCIFVYTGAIDALFGNKYGELPYRSLRFDFQTHHKDSFHSSAIVAYPQEPGFTRITEFKKLTVQDIHDVTTIAVEYPAKFSIDTDTEPYYPIPTDDSALQYAKYKQQADGIKNLVLCGRLAEYKYYNMDQAVWSSLSLAKR